MTLRAPRPGWQLRTAVIAIVAMVATIALVALDARPVQAQAAAGRVSGTISSATPGFTVPDSVQLRLIVLEGAKVTDAIVVPTRGGAYSASVPIVAGRTLVPHLTYEGVDYFASPVTLTEDAREVVRDFSIYAVTHETPDLAIASTTMTVIAIDRERGQLGLLREDQVANPADRVYIGDDQRVTLRIPAPTGTIEASGDNTDGTFVFERGVVTTTVPIRPGKLNTIITRYVVAYDPADDAYALRATSPLPTERVRVRVPEGYARAIRPDAGARRVDDERLTGQGADQVLQVVQSTGRVNPGGGVVAQLRGLSAPVAQVNPLTEPRGAVLASVLALAIIGGGTALAWRRYGRPA